jgi:hypothetical protein
MAQKDEILDIMKKAVLNTIENGSLSDFENILAKNRHLFSLDLLRYCSNLSNVDYVYLLLRNFRNELNRTLKNSTRALKNEIDEIKKKVIYGLIDKDMFNLFSSFTGGNSELIDIELLRFCSKKQDTRYITCLLSHTNRLNVLREELMDKPEPMNNMSITITDLDKMTTPKLADVPNSTYKPSKTNYDHQSAFYDLIFDENYGGFVGLAEKHPDEVELGMLHQAISSKSSKIVIYLMERYNFPMTDHYHDLIVDTGNIKFVLDLFEADLCDDLILTRTSVEKGDYEMFNALIMADCSYESDVYMLAPEFHHMTVIKIITNYQTKKMISLYKDSNAKKINNV